MAADYHYSFVVETLSFTEPLNLATGTSDPSTKPTGFFDVVKGLISY
jgi:hypothetical protein